MISAVISAIDFTLDLFFLLDGQTFDGQTASLRRALTESQPFCSTSFAHAAQHVKFTKIQHYSYGWV